MSGPIYANNFMAASTRSPFRSADFAIRPVTYAPFGFGEATDGVMAIGYHFPFPAIGHTTGKPSIGRGRQAGET